MKVAVDTNVLVRAVVYDDPRQARIADRVLKGAPVIVVALSCLCEFAWVLKRVYAFSPPKVADAIRLLVNAANVEMNRPVVEAGLAMLDAGGDFADGIIAAEGRWMGGGTFVSFDSQAVRKLMAQRHAARLLGSPQPSVHQRRKH